MRFGMVHRIMTSLVGALSVLAIASVGMTTVGTNVLLIALLAGALVVPDRWQARPLAKRVFNLGALALMIVQTVRWGVGEHPLDVMVEFIAYLQVLRLATRRGAAHDPVVLGLALLEFVAGAILGGGLLYALCFLGFIIAVPGALVLSHLRREVEGNYRQGARDRTGLPVDVPRILRSRRVVGRGFLFATCLLSFPILFSMALIFLIFPRVGLSLFFVNHSRSAGVVGFSDRVDLGQVGALRLDPSLSLRFEPASLPATPPPRWPLRLRGTAYDTYDGKAWSRSPSDRRGFERYGETLLLRRLPTFNDERILFDLEPIDPPVVFLPAGAVAIQPRPGSPVLNDPLVLHRGGEGEIRYSGGDTRGLRYEVYVGKQDPPLEVLGPLDRARYLTIPLGFPERIGTLAHEWTDALPAARAKAKFIEERLKTTFIYDLSAPSGGTPQPVDHFLFVSHRGHCEFFSTAMAMMLREIGIPSRTVNGFVGGEYNRFGKYYAVRRSNAHAWVEVFLEDPNRPGTGSWNTFDPTPTSTLPVDARNSLSYARDIFEAIAQRWQHHVMGYDLQSQIHAVHWLSRATSSFRGETGSPANLRARVRLGVFALALGSIALWVYFWLRRRQTTRAGEATARATPSEVATLYAALERALTKLGHARPLHITPLRHAEHLYELPYGREVRDLTEIYLRLRFGGMPLSEDDREAFLARVGRLPTRLPPSAVSSARAIET